MKASKPPTPISFATAKRSAASTRSRVESRGQRHPLSLSPNTFTQSSIAFSLPHGSPCRSQANAIKTFARNLSPKPAQTQPAPLNTSTFAPPESSKATRGPTITPHTHTKPPTTFAPFANFVVKQIQPKVDRSLRRSDSPQHPASPTHPNQTKPPTTFAPFVYFVVK